MNFSTLAETVASYAAGTSIYRIYYAQPGHPGEYTVNIGGPHSVDDIPSYFELALEEILGDSWTVWHRGSRLEIISNDHNRPRDDEVILAALAKVCGSN